MSPRDSEAAVTSVDTRATVPSVSHSVLLVEDEIGIRVAIEDSLRIAGYVVAVAEDGEAALELARKGDFDAIILDVLLPKKDGVEVCEELRGMGIDTPVLMLTVKSELEDRMRGFAVGADDYLTKPFQVMELIARIRAIVRRIHPPASTDSYEFGDVRLDPKRAAAWRRGQRIQLSMKEYELLHYFVTHPDETLERQRLLKEIWKHKPQDATRTVDVHVGWLRGKIEEDPSRPRWIRTVYGKGYEFVPD